MLLLLIVDCSYGYPDAKLDTAVHTGGTKITARITIFPEDDSETNSFGIGQMQKPQ